MGGVNLSKESKNILASNADFIGAQIRSCKDEAFMHYDIIIALLIYVYWYELVSQVSDMAHGLL